MVFKDIKEVALEEHTESGEVTEEEELIGGVWVIDQGEEDGGGDGVIGDTVDDTAIGREGLSLSGELSIGAIEDEAKEDEE